MPVDVGDGAVGVGYGNRLTGFDRVASKIDAVRLAALLGTSPDRSSRAVDGEVHQLDGRPVGGIDGWSRLEVPG